ncbi:MAG: zinc metallopeptidase [Bacillota bacterium]
METLLVASISMLTLGVPMWMLHRLAVFWKKRNIVFPVGCGELAETLLKRHKLDYRVVFDSNASGRCDWRRKTIRLSYSREERHLAAVFQAAHEVGHAVRGPALFAGILLLFWGAYFAWLLMCLWGGFAWSKTAWPSALALIAFLFGVRTVDFWVDELKATRYARRELERLVADDAERLALRVHFIAYCLAHIVLPVSVSVALLWIGRLLWRLGVFWGGG